MTMFSCLSCTKIQKQKSSKRCHHFLNMPLEPRLADSCDILEEMELEKMVKLPAGGNKLEWIAVNLPDFVNIVAVLYEGLVDICTDKSCPSMNACPIYHYRRNAFLRHPERYSAVRYVHCLIAWVDALIDSGLIFPTKKGITFPLDFIVISRMIFTALLYVYGHLYQNHYNDSCRLCLVVHLNTAFKHFVLFAREFDLIDESDCEPLKTMIEFVAGGDTPDGDQSSTDNNECSSS